MIRQRVKGSITEDMRANEKGWVEKRRDGMSGRNDSGVLGGTSEQTLTRVSLTIVKDALGVLSSRAKNMLFQKAKVVELNGARCGEGEEKEKNEVRRANGLLYRIKRDTGFLQCCPDSR